ncbi:MAG: hypothetical protein J2P32_13595 [Actinobacteria bacterium]|nr:hypothetical protein [Actinomycetota bacterium]
MRHRIWILAGSAAIGLTVAACGGSSGGGGSSSPAAQGSGQPASSGSMVKSGKAGGATVLTNSQGMTLYWFAIDSSTKSKCTSSTCVHFWHPVKGPVTVASGINGKVGTITRSDGSVQATYDGHPLYTFLEDHSPGQATGNGKNLDGGVWHEVTVSGKASGGGGGSGGGYGY